MSSNSTIVSAILQLRVASQYISIIVGLILFIGGMIGNFLNITVFFILGNWKHNASSLYILIRSLLDFLIILVGLSTAILSYGFQLDFTLKNRVWCKLRVSFITISFLSSLTYICLQSIDVFFTSSQSIILRQKSNVQIARNLIIGSLLFWTVHTIPNFFLQDLILRGSTFICTGTNSIYVQYNNYFMAIGLYVVIPVIIITVFGYLTHRNLRHAGTRERRLLSALSRQMISMALFQIGTLLIFQAPFGIAIAYNLGTASLTKDAYRQTQEQVALTFFFNYTYGTCACPFYCYYIISKRYRQQVSDVLKQLLSIRTNQILPASQSNKAPIREQYIDTTQL